MKPNYRVVEADGWQLIETQPAPLPKRLVFFGAVFGFVLAFLATVFTPPHSAFIGAGGSHFLFFVIAGVPAGVWFFRWRATRTRRVPGAPFAIRRDAVRLPSGDIVARERIDRLVLSNTQQGSPVLVGGTGMRGATMLAQGEARERLASVSYAVAVEHDGSSSVLAAGLTLPQANALFVEVTRRLDGFQA